jgi:hypothetical protein
MLRSQRGLQRTETGVEAVDWTLPLTDAQFLICGRVLMVASLNEVALLFIMFNVVLLKKKEVWIDEV